MSDRKLTYWIDGAEYSGTLQDYATALQHEALEGVQVGIVVRTDKGQLVQPQRNFSGYNVDDMGYTTVTLSGYGEAGYSVDGRA